MNIFIDCGFYNGTTIKRYMDKGIIDDTWTIYAFEPNAKLPVDTYLESLPLKIEMIRKAVWIRDEELEFHLSGREDSSHVFNQIMKGNPEKVIFVQGMDFSAFVAELPDDAHIICSMDIEGCEYPVLEKMFEDNTIDKISLLEIEFHHRFMQDKTPTDSNRLVRQLRKRGVKIKLKVPIC